MDTGIYKIENKITKKIYVGSTTIGFKGRFSAHLSTLKKNKHPNKYLQNSFNKYGIESFEFSIIEELCAEKCINREQYWIDFYKATEKEFGYNICPIAGNTAGRIASDETKLKLKIAATGFKHSEESKKLMTLAQIENRKLDSEKRKLRWKEIIKDYRLINARPVLMLDKNLNILSKYESIAKASSETNIPKSTISICCKNLSLNRKTKCYFAYEKEFI